jgi:hypothetical protein
VRRIHDLTGERFQVLVGAIAERWTGERAELAHVVRNADLFRERLETPVA